MTRTRDILLSVAAISVIMYVFGLADVARTAAQSTVDAVQQVLVTNTTSQPVPVKSVGTTVVKVANLPAAPVWTRDVNEARQPIHRQKNTYFDEGDDYLSDTILYTVPAGKRLVIEYVSARGNVPLDQGVLYAGVATTSAGVISSHHVNPEWRGHYGASYYVAGTATRIYADPGTNVHALAGRSGTTGTASWTTTFSGYLVNIP